jgi:hypothetical protein
MSPRGPDDRGKIPLPRRGKQGDGLAGRHAKAQASPLDEAMTWAFDADVFTQSLVGYLSVQATSVVPPPTHT